MKDKINSKVKGGVAEGYAADFLLQQGYLILDRNFQTKWGELDIIAQEGEQIVFVEVRSIFRGADISVNELVPKHKIAKLERMTDIWVQQFQPKDWRVDFIGVVLDENMGLVEMTHYKNI